MAYDSANGGQLVLFGGNNGTATTTTPGPGTAVPGRSSPPHQPPSPLTEPRWHTTRPTAASWSCSAAPTLLRPSAIPGPGTTTPTPGPSSPPPPAPSAASVPMAYDPANGGQLVLFGGRLRHHRLQRHLGLERGDLGHSLFRPPAPAPATFSPCSYDVATNQMVLFGGYKPAHLLQRHLDHGRPQRHIPQHRFRPDDGVHPSHHHRLRVRRASGQRSRQVRHDSGGQLHRPARPPRSPPAPRPRRPARSTSPSPAAPAPAPRRAPTSSPTPTRPGTRPRRPPPDRPAMARRRPMTRPPGQTIMFGGSERLAT